MQVVMPSLGWRWLLTLSSVPLAVLLLFYKFVPESPRYLAAQGETTSAVKILQQMARVNQRSLPLGRLVVVGSEELQTLAQQRQQATQETMTEEEEEEEKIQFLLLVEDKGPPVLLHQVNKETSPIGGVLSSFTTLLSPPLISSTILLWSVFFANAFTYYGLVLLTSQLSGQGGGCDTDLVASSTAVASTSDNTQLYRDVFVSSIGGRFFFNWVNQLHKNDDVLHEETGDIVDGIEHFLHMMFLPLDFFDEVSEVKTS
jgi:hypothetical protein